MNGNRYLADTNAFIYLLRKHPNVLPLVDGEWSYTFITRIELLGKPGITPSETELVKALLDICIALPHLEPINDLAIQLRQLYKIKTPDAIIAASCIFYDLPL